MSRSPLGCQVEGCEHVGLMRVEGTRVCLTHEEPVSKTAANARWGDFEAPRFRCFRFRRSRAGYETWLIYGNSSMNLSAHDNNILGPDAIPPMRLREAEANALMLAMKHGFPYVDIDRCITRELMRELFRAPTVQETADHSLLRYLSPPSTLELKGKWP